MLSMFDNIVSAGQVLLPTTLDQLLPAGNYAVNVETFSDFSYNTSPVGIQPFAKDITVSAFIDNGLTFTGAFATPGATVDYVITYDVIAPTNKFITDASLSVVWNLIKGSTGVGSIGETFIDPSNNKVLGSLNLTSPDPGTINVDFKGVREILVQRDIILFGGDKGIGVSVINRGYSTPEPGSIVLLGLGLCGILILKRHLK